MLLNSGVVVRLGEVVLGYAAAILLRIATYYTYFFCGSLQFVSVMAHRHLHVISVLKEDLLAGDLCSKAVSVIHEMAVASLFW